MPFKNGNAHLDVMRQMHKAAFRNNLGVDFVLAENADFTGYQILLVPPLYIASDALLKKISDFVENGGHVIMSVKSGFCDENSVVRYTKAPGPLRKAAGFFYQEFSTIKSLSLRDDPFKVGGEKTKQLIGLNSSFLKQQKHWRVMTILSLENIRLSLKINLVKEVLFMKVRWFPMKFNQN